MDDTTTGPPGAVGDRRQVINEKLGDIIDEMQDFIEQLRRHKKAVKDDPSKAPDATKCIDGANKLMFSLRVQEDKFYDYSDERAGAAREFALNLDHARSEVGRRLSSLRAAAGADGVSEQPDGT